MGAALMAPVPVVLLHSFPVDGRLWRPQVERLAAQDPTRVVLAPDLRGFGRNTAGPLPDSVEAHARDVVELLDQQGLARAFVAGLSMGGYVALALHRLAPQRVAGLLLADTRAVADPPEAWADRAAQAARMEREGMAFVPDLWLPLLLASGCAAEVRLELRRLILEQNPYGAAAGIRMIGRRPDATAGLGAIQVPTAVVCGEHDGLTTPAVMREMAAAIAGASFTLVPGAGHMTSLEAPEHFNHALLAALARLDGAR